MINDRLIHRLGKGKVSPLMTENCQVIAGYINLERNGGRRARMEARLRKFNLQDRYFRFAAVDAETVLVTTPQLECGQFV